MYYVGGDNNWQHVRMVMEAAVSKLMVKATGTSAQHEPFIKMGKAL